jgi:hypothetical protein
MDDNKEEQKEEPSLLFSPIGIAGIISVVIVVLFLAPHFYVGPVRAPRNSCINNLRQLDAAVQEWALEHKKVAGDTPKWSEIMGTNGTGGYLKRPMICPQGGIYNLGSVGGRPTCSIEGHDLPADTP